jgi:hypothetical protein
VVRPSAGSAELRAALDVSASHQNAVGTLEVVERLALVLTLPFPNNMADFGKRILMFEYDEVQQIVRHVYELMALMVRHNARNARLLAPLLPTMLQQLGHNLGVAEVLRDVLALTPCRLSEASVEAIFVLLGERRDARYYDVLAAAVRSDDHSCGNNRMLVERALFGERWRHLLPAFEQRDGAVLVRDDAKQEWLRVSTMSRARSIQWRVDALTSTLRLFAVLCAPRASTSSARVARLLARDTLLLGRLRRSGGASDARGVCRRRVRALRRRGAQSLRALAGVAARALSARRATRRRWSASPPRRICTTSPS